MFSLGPEAVELARRAGLEADPWQADSLEVMCGVRADGKWACFEYAEWVPRQNGKGGALEIRALAGLLLFGERLIMWSAHEYKTAMEAFLRVENLVKALGTQINPKTDTHWDVDGILIKICRTNGEEGFERYDEKGRLVGRIKFIARSKGSGRGFSGDLNIIDEAFAYTNSQHRALLPTVSARPNGQFIYTSSPPLDGETGEVMYRLRHRGDPTLERPDGEAAWSQDPSLGYRDWGAGGDLDHLDEIDLDSRDLWQATNPACPHRITLETIARERLSMAARDFAQERLGIWPAQSKAAGVLLRPEQWKAMRDPESKRHGDVVLMPDVTPMRDHGSIGLFGLREDGLEHVQLIDYRPGATWMVKRMVELHEALDPLCWVIDTKNGTAAFLAELAEHGIRVPDDPEHPHRGAVLLLDVAGVALATGQFINAYELQALRHIGQQPLDDAVGNVKARPIGDQGQIAWGRRISDVDIGPVVTITGARYGFYLWRDLIDTQPAQTGFAWILGGSRAGS